MYLAIVPISVAGSSPVSIADTRACDTAHAVGELGLAHLVPLANLSEAGSANLGDHALLVLGDFGFVKVGAGANVPPVASHHCCLSSS